MILSRRSLITTGAAFLAAPAIVRASSLMIIKPERRVIRLIPAEEWRYATLLIEGTVLVGISIDQLRDNVIVRLV